MSRGGDGCDLASVDRQIERRSWRPPFDQPDTNGVGESGVRSCGGPDNRASGTITSSVGVVAFRIGPTARSRPDRRPTPPTRRHSPSSRRTVLDFADDRLHPGLRPIQPTSPIFLPGRDIVAASLAARTCYAGATLETVTRLRLRTLCSPPPRWSGSARNGAPFSSARKGPPPRRRRS